MSHPRRIHAWTVLASEYLHKQPWLTVRRDRVRLPAGAVIDDYFVLEYPDWVNVIAVTPDDQIITIRQYRHGSGTVNVELPAGVIDPGDSSPLAAAQRELREETGYGGGEWSHLITLSANASTHSNRTHCFLARDVMRLSDPSLEPTEDIDVELMSHSRLESLVHTGQVLQALNVAPILLYLSQRPRRA